ncbi:MAG: hypothetical protein ABIZ95_21550, partial [Pyrinomonadaceae bacterium]
MRLYSLSLIEDRFAPGFGGLIAVTVFFMCFYLVNAQALPSAEPLPDDRPPLIVEGTAGNVFGVARPVIVRGQVTEGVIAFGGDVIIEGKVDGDVAAIGGSVFQRDGSYIGGDVIVLGGAYHHGKNPPGRNPASSTIMVAGYEQELRAMTREPTALLAPSLSAGYFGLRGLAVLFWFVLSWAFAAITPGAISRAIVRIRSTHLRVAIIGLLGAVVAFLGVGGGLRVLPTTIGAMVLLVAVLLTVMAYLFGRVVIHAATGQWLQRMLLPDSWRSDTSALLLGAAFWTLILSLPYVWPVAIIGLMIVGFGVCLTG